MKAHVCLGLSLLLLAPLAVAQEWPQWGLDAKHSSQFDEDGQNLNRNIVNIVYDPLVPQELAATGGDLLAHFQAPLVDDDDAYMMFKSGVFDETSYATQTWGETKFHWSGGTLVPVWQFTSDWKAPGSLDFDFWEPVFHPALANDALYVPGAGGTLIKVSKNSGAQVARINPFSGGINTNRFTVSPITVDNDENLFYNVVELVPGTQCFFCDNVVDSWLVKVKPNGTTTKVSYSVLTAGAPAGNAQCQNAFSTEPLPWPPSPTAVPPSITCGTQRPAVNVSPAIGSDGTLYVATRAHFLSRETFLVAVKPNLTQKWIRSLRNRFNDGCGVPHASGGQLPANGQPGGCRAGANLGVDPATNTAGGGRILDDGTATVTVAPDGSLFFGAYTRYNYAQGHLMHFSSNGNYLGAYKFGWDVTVGIYSHDGTYSVVTKDNHYGGVGSYCNDETFCPSDRNASDPGYPEQYFITQLNPNLGIEWSYQNTNTLSCTRQPNGSVTCVSDHPNGFEWCVNAFVIDEKGIVYANSEDGNLFAIKQGGTLKKKIFQQLALGAAYTPTSMDDHGRVYSQNAGHLFVAGQ
jgi:hypothetical protein